MSVFSRLESDLPLEGKNGPSFETSNEEFSVIDSGARSHRPESHDHFTAQKWVREKQNVFNVPFYRVSEASGLIKGFINDGASQVVTQGRKRRGAGLIRGRNQDSHGGNSGMLEQTRQSDVNKGANTSSNAGRGRS